MVVQETSVGAHQGTTLGLQIAPRREARAPIFDLRDLKTRTRVYLPAVHWEAELVRWLAHAAQAAASGNDALKQRSLDRCTGMLRSRNFRFAACRQPH
jgi:hypothetical protein